MTENHTWGSCLIIINCVLHFIYLLGFIVVSRNAESNPLFIHMLMYSFWYTWKKTNFKNIALLTSLFVCSICYKWILWKETSCEIWKTIKALKAFFPLVVAGLWINWNEKNSRLCSTYCQAQDVGTGGRTPNEQAMVKKKHSVGRTLMHWESFWVGESCAVAWRNVHFSSH